MCNDSPPPRLLLGVEPRDGTGVAVLLDFVMCLQTGDWYCRERVEVWDCCWEEYFQSLDYDSTSSVWCGDSWRWAHMHGAWMMSMHAQDIERKEGRESKEASGPASQPNLSLPSRFWTFWLPAYMHSVSQSRFDWLIDCLTTSTLVGLNQRLALPTSLHPVLLACH
jgi:hypothetical protein